MPNVEKITERESLHRSQAAVVLFFGRPLPLGNSFGDTVLGVFDFETEKDYHQVKSEKFTMGFYCDYNTKWICPTVYPAQTPMVTPLTSLVKNTFKPG